MNDICVHICRTVNQKNDCGGFLSDLPVFALTPGPTPGTHLASGCIDDLALIGGFRFCFSKGRESVTRFRETTLQALMNRVQVVGANGQTIFYGNCVSHVGD